MIRLASLTAVFAALVLALAACGGGDESEPAPEGGGGGGGGGGSTLQIAADPGGALEFDKSSLEASAGEVTIDFTNDSSLPHDFKIEGNGVEGEGTDVVTGGSTSATVDLEPGTYTFYCSVDGHRQAGMEGTLTVQ